MDFHCESLFSKLSKHMSTRCCQYTFVSTAVIVLLRAEGRTSCSRRVCFVWTASFNVPSLQAPKVEVEKPISSEAEAEAGVATCPCDRWT